MLYWLIPLVIYLVGFLLAARGFDYGPTGTGTDKLIGALIWPVIVIYAVWRIWTKQITATLTWHGRNGKVHTRKLGKKV